MPASLRFLDSDGSTVVTTINLGSVLSPGASSNKLLYVENTGDQTAQDVTVEIEAVGTNDGDDYALLAEDVSGSPGSFGTTALDLGDIAAAAKSPFWTKASLVAGVSAEGNTREYKLLAEGQTV